MKKLKLFSCSVMAMLAVNAFSAESKAVTQENLKSHISGWSPEASKAADFMFKKYGAPSDMTSNMVVWTNVKPFKRSILYKEAVTHNFPMEHKDVLEHFIDYKAPEAQKVADVWNFDGSVMLERTKGEMSARCDREEAISWHSIWPTRL